MQIVYITGILEQLYFEGSFLPPCIFSTTYCPDAGETTKKTSNPAYKKITKIILLKNPLLNYIKNKHKWGRKIKGTFGFYYICKLSIAPASKFRVNMVIPGLLDIPINKKAPSNTSFSNQAMPVTMR